MSDDWCHSHCHSGENCCGCLCHVFSLFSGVLVRLAVKVFMQNDKNFMEVIHPYIEAGIDYYLPKVFSPALKVVVKNDRNFMKLILLFLKSGKIKHCFLKVVTQNNRNFLELIHLYLKRGNV